MVRGSLLAIVALLASAACSTILGFDDIERVDRLPLDGDASVATAPRDASPAEVLDGDASAAPDADAAPTDSGTPAASKTCPAPSASYVPAWVSPPTRPKPCQTQDVTTFINNELRPFAEQKATMAAKNAACADCVFTSEGDAVWGPITHTNDDRIFVGFGFCYRAAGASESCASKAHALEWCLQKICNVCVAGQTMNECRGAAKAGSCKTQLDTTLIACESFPTIVNTTCGGSGNVVGVLCGGK